MKNFDWNAVIAIAVVGYFVLFRAVPWVEKLIRVETASCEIRSRTDRLRGRGRCVR